MTGETPINTAGLHDFLISSKVPNLPFVSEKQVDNQFEIISCHSRSPRNDPSISEMSNQFSNKRNHSDCTLMGSVREGRPQMNCDRSNLMKMFRNASGGERPRMSPYDRPLHGSPQNRPLSPSFMMQQTTCAIAKLPKCENSSSMNSGGSSILYCNPHIGQASPVMYQMPSSRFKEGSSYPTVLSRLAADEGSGTGNKNSGILKSVNSSNCLVSERCLSGVVPSGGNVNPMTCTFEPESSNSQGRRRVTSSSRQMTIIFDGQLHVFDDVNPNKANAIMSLAGSNGGSWSTTLTNSSVGKPINVSYVPSRETKRSSSGDRSLQLKHNSKQYGSGISAMR